MKQLSYSQAFRCELAIGKVCKCRCDGLLHGAMRASKEELEYEEFYNNLDTTDPHHVDNYNQKLEKFEKSIELVDKINNIEVTSYGPFPVANTLPFGDEGILFCPFCGIYFRVNLLRLVNSQYFTYKTGWLHKCTQAKLVTSEPSSYMSMLIRCYNQQHPSYKSYGAKGFIVISEWKDSFEMFLWQMKLKPNQDAMIGRISKQSKIYSWGNCGWVVDGKIVSGKEICLLHTMYKFSGEWFKFWLVSYDYGRAPKVLRTEEYQAPMTLLNEDMTFSRIAPADEKLVTKWLDKFGEKFGYEHARQIDNGNAEYIEVRDTQLALNLNGLGSTTKL